VLARGYYVHIGAFTALHHGTARKKRRGISIKPPHGTYPAGCPQAVRGLRLGLRCQGIGPIVLVLQVHALQDLEDVVKIGKGKHLKGSQALGRLRLETGLEHLRHLRAEVCIPD
jgi:hypothetical protein